MLNTGHKIFIAIAFLLCLCLFGGGEAYGSSYPRLERRADRAFIRGNFEKAMQINEYINSRLPDGIEKLKLELKMARLYTLLQKPEHAIRYYESVHLSADTMLTVNDACLYIDALRSLGYTQEAEAVARRYAFQSPYSRNQRYMNTLLSLSNKQHYYAKGDSDYAVELLEINTDLPEYWIGQWDGERFYAVSHSPLQDPLKIYYHRTQYLSMDNPKELSHFRAIPLELQSGPVAFSKDKTMMIATTIDYKRNDRIIDLYENEGIFVNQLRYSTIDKRRGSWASGVPLFADQKGYNYAHPSLYNNDKSLVFSSDRPGGYGGMDLYISHWNETAGSWSDPKNLGPAVNTEGDEIYPLIADSLLYFSSNGHEGFGGYDIYNIGFDENNNIVIPGNKFHYPYPVNSVVNDFGVYLDGGIGYFISDRRGSQGKDDIYKFDATVTPLGSENAIGVSDESAALNGTLNVINGLNNINNQVSERALRQITSAARPADSEVLLTVYFDFNSHVVKKEYLAKLDALLADKRFNDAEEITLVGYADELGTPQYNQKLSEQRAQAVARYMEKNNTKPRLIIEGRGQIQLSKEEYKSELENISKDNSLVITGDNSGVKSRLSLDDRIRINRKARRVDIIVKK